MLFCWAGHFICSDRLLWVRCMVETWPFTPRKQEKGKIWRLPGGSEDSLGSVAHTLRIIVLGRREQPEPGTRAQHAMGGD